MFTLIYLVSAVYFTIFVIWNKYYKIVRETDDGQILWEKLREKSVSYEEIAGGDYETPFRPISFDRQNVIASLFIVCCLQILTCWLWFGLYCLYHLLLFAGNIFSKLFVKIWDN